MKRLAFALVLGLVSFGCAGSTATYFDGKPRASQGPATCAAQCQAWGMELVGMVSMGDNYTDGCICAVPGKQITPAQSASAAAGAVAGVTWQTQAAAAAAQAASQQQQQHSFR